MCEPYAMRSIINIDETGVYYDMPPSKILARRGGSSKVANIPSHSARLTAVLGVRADGMCSTCMLSYYVLTAINLLCLICFVFSGTKLPILFILKGSEHGTIRRKEIPTYPKGQSLFPCFFILIWIFSLILISCGLIL